MGLFSKTDLSDCRSVLDAVQDYARQVAFYGRGVGDQELLEESAQRASGEMSFARERLSAEGRFKDLKALEKQLLNAGNYIDNGAYNSYYSPLIWKCLGVRQ